MSLRVAAVTGAGGFVGRRLCERLVDEGVDVIALVRHAHSPVPKGCGVRVIGDLAQRDPDWSAAIERADVVFHLAALAHSPSADAELVHRVNVGATSMLAAAAFESGTRLVFASSIKANAEASDVPVDETSPLAPTSVYGRSKRDAERAIAQAADGALTGDARWIALRPPLLYGPGDEGNFARLAGLVRRGVPLPLASVRNRRSMMHVANFVDALLHAARLDTVPNAAFVVDDGPAQPIGDWVRAIGVALGRPARLFPCPPAVLATMARLANREAMAIQVLGSLEADGRAWRAASGWVPVLNRAESMTSAVCN